MPEFNKYQKWILENYENGEFTNHSTMKTLIHCGDGLLVFLMNELEDVDTSEEALHRIERAQKQVEDLFWKFSVGGVG